MTTLIETRPEDVVSRGLEGALLGRRPWAEIVVVTPDLARYLLDHGIRNRTIRERKVAEYAQALTDGQWRLNGETIVVNSRGIQENGAHRCLAVLKSGKPMETFIVWGVEPGAARTVDQGTKRTTADTLRMEGESNANTLASACGWVRLLEAHADGEVEITHTSMALRALTNPGVIEFLGTHPGLRDSVIPGLRVYKVLRQSSAMWVALHYHFAQRNQADADEFYEQLTTGINLGPNEPAYLLRERLFRLTSKERNTVRVLPFVTAALVIKAWNAYRRQADIRQLKWTYGVEAFPEAV